MTKVEIKKHLILKCLFLTNISDYYRCVNHGIYKTVYIKKWENNSVNMEKYFCWL